MPPRNSVSPDPPAPNLHAPVLAAVERAGSWDRVAVLSDFDGTLSQIVPVPEHARVLPSSRRALVALAARAAFVAVISGRTAADLMARVGEPGLRYAGCHGFDWPGNAADQTVQRAVQQARAGFGEVSACLAPVIAAEPGVFLEDKTSALAVHYRRSGSPEQAREAILKLVAPQAAALGLRLVEGRRVVEVLPGMNLGKGYVARQLLSDTPRVRTAVCLGDDLGDVDLFQGCRSWASERDGREAVCVGVAGAETPAELLACADVTLPGPRAVGRLLLALTASQSR